MGEIPEAVRQRRDRWWSAAAAAAAVGGVVIALAVVRLGVGETATSRAYVERPEFGVFGGLVLLQVPTWAVLGVLSARWAAEIRALPPHEDRPLWQVVLAWVGAAIAIGALLAAQGAATYVDVTSGETTSGRQYPDGQGIRVVAMATVVAFAAAVPAVALRGLSRAADAIATDLAGPPADGTGDAQLTALERRQRYRAALGIDEGLHQHLERGAVLLAPLLTALVTTLLPGVQP